MFSDDEASEGGRDVQLSINEHYAKAFEYRKDREELERLKEKYGSDYDSNTSGLESSTDSESAESEDENGEELTPTVDAAILRTLARIKGKDPAIYDSRKNIFGEEQEKIGTKPEPLKASFKAKDKSKPVTIRQAKLDSLLNDSRSPSPNRDAHTATYVEEQDRLRKDTIAAFHNAVPTGEGDDFLIARDKTKDELVLEEEEYRAFLEREVGDIKKLVSLEDETLKHLVNGEHDANVVAKADRKVKKKQDKTGSDALKVKKTRAEKDQEFLMNYILNRGWIDRSERHVPTYEEVTSMKRKKNVEAPINAEDDTILLSDSSFDSIASHFEASYNHRFEEPDAAAIPSFPRQIQSTVRRQDTTRKEARERRKARKEDNLAKKKEEVRTLKALKMREARRKLEIIRKQAGLKGRVNDKGKGKGKREEAREDDVEDDEALLELDLEGEWDAEQHDQQMSSLFEREDVFEEYDSEMGDNGIRFDADGKPIWDDDIDIGDIIVPADEATSSGEVEKKKKKKKKKKDQGDEDVGVDVDDMDADAEPLFEDYEEWDGTEEMRKKVLKKYMDELDGLDFNDMVSDIPTRFRYLPVQATHYSLTPAEVLMATDKELNEYMSVKKYATYKPADPKRFSKANQEKLRELKGKVAERTGSVFGFGIQEDGEVKIKKRKGKKERMRMKVELEGGGGDDGDGGGDLEDSEILTHSSSLSKRKSGDTDVLEGDNEGIPKKKKRKRKHKKIDEV